MFLTANEAVQKQIIVGLGPNPVPTRNQTHTTLDHSIDRSINRQMNRSNRTFCNLRMRD